ncbi:hypothetical protein AB7Z57_07690 [Providencia alcalifaciens]
MAIKRTITLNFKTSDGKTLPASFDVSDGESAFEVWKKLPGNAAKTEAQFFAEQKGADGKNGTNGADGKNGSNGAQGASIVNVSVQVKENP